MLASLGLGSIADASIDTIEQHADRVSRVDAGTWRLQRVGGRATPARTTMPIRLIDASQFEET